MGGRFLVDYPVVAAGASHGFTLACGRLVGSISACVIGFAAGIICYIGVMAKNRFGYDDSLDVVGVHGVSGAIGLLAAGLFASKSVNPGGPDGHFFGNPKLLGIQCIAIAATLLYSFVLSYIFLKIIDKLFGLRLPVHEEINGLDLSQHDEKAYIF